MSSFGRVAIGYALRDLLHDRGATFLACLLYIAILTPAILLFILKTGALSALTDRLESDIRNREIVLRGEYKLEAQDISFWRGQEHVGFVVPEASFLISTQPFRRRLPERGSYADINMRTTAIGDPVTRFREALPTDRVILSEAAAIALEVRLGDMIEMRNSRQPRNASIEVVQTQLLVADILDESNWPPKTIFVAPELAIAVRDWLQFEADVINPRILDREADYTRTWQSMRIYARTIHQTLPLRDALEKKGFSTRVHTDQVVRLIELGEGLNALFLLVFILTLLAFCTAILVLQWLNVVRKAKDLALLALIGFGHRHMRMFCNVQGFVVITLASVSAFALSWATISVIEPYLKTLLDVAQISPPRLVDIGLGFALTTVLGYVATHLSVAMFKFETFIGLLRSD